jgi:acyl-CoA dehydrogenase
MFCRLPAACPDIVGDCVSGAHQDIRDAVRDLCRQFPDEYFRGDRRAARYPEAFVDALIGAGWLSAMIPEEYGGSGLG